MPDVKVCTACKFELPETRFNSKGGGQRRNQCRDCHGYVKTDTALVDQISKGGELMLMAASEGQRLLVEHVLEESNVVRAARLLEMLPNTARSMLARVIAEASARGWSPAHDIKHPIPPGFRLRGTSTLYDADGNVTQQWHKTEREIEDKLQILLDAAAHLTEQWPDEIKPLPTEPPSLGLDEDLLAVYPMGDPHLGMLAWAPETGEHFDLKIAERQLYAAADHLVTLAPHSERALLINAGDFFHADNDKNTTYKGTPVDTDGRYPYVYRTGILLMKRLIDRMLQKHKYITVINEIGNHDTSTSILLSIVLDALYSNEPRVHVDTSPMPFHYYKFGKVFLMTHHGDRVKGRDLFELMACDRAEDWGSSKHRHIYVGHVHHDTVKELRGVTIETLRTLAAKDKWHTAEGYRSGRDMKLDVWHREHGYKGRHVIDISLVKAITGDN